MRDPDLIGCGHTRRFAPSEQLARAAAKCGDIIPADVSGEWKAWRVHFDATELRPRDAAAMGLWFLYAPGAHPFWAWHAVTMCHLREMPGVEPAKLIAPNMSHELLIGALDPSWSPIVDTPIGWGKYLLQPANMVRQVADLDDEQAAELLHLVTRGLVNGWMNPDDDFRAVNAGFIDGTADHLRSGKHMPS